MQDPFDQALACRIVAHPAFGALCRRLETDDGVAAPPEQRLPQQLEQGEHAVVGPPVP
ncbi:hypothetical protein ACTVZO_37760 [Streptomyces sp. IBSNAI002]|uniref:hypothetical protein n=1 Tax=Streptomyces sp. IBSNAI002 TaxID=3457500 RepID=UPI003FD465B8